VRWWARVSGAVGVVVGPRWACGVGRPSGVDGLLGRRLGGFFSPIFFVLLFLFIFFLLFSVFQFLLYCFSFIKRKTHT
jgi:hypothetical protein